MTDGGDSGFTRIGLIAGGGQLPREVVSACGARSVFVVRIAGHADDPFDDADGVEHSIGEIGAILRSLKQAGCDAVCFAGYVTRPDFRTLKLDARGLMLLPRIVAAGRRGDDAILRVVVETFERAGFQVVGADQLIGQQALPPGYLGPAIPDQDMLADARKAMQIAAEIGRLDIGQGAVVVDGLVVAVEAQEGTNAMLERVAGLPEALRGTAGALRGVLAKRPKPIQERRIDLPTIGVDTVRLCHSAGLAGIVLEAGGALIVDREGVIRALTETGLFLRVEERGDD